VQTCPDLHYPALQSFLCISLSDAGEGKRKRLPDRVCFSVEYAQAADSNTK